MSCAPFKLARTNALSFLYTNGVMDKDFKLLRPENEAKIFIDVINRNIRKHGIDDPGILTADGLLVVDEMVFSSLQQLFDGEMEVEITEVQESDYNPGEQQAEMAKLNGVMKDQIQQAFSEQYNLTQVEQEFVQGLLDRGALSAKCN